MKFVTGTKVLRILKAKGLASEIPEDLYHMIKKAVSIRKHLERNRKVGLTNVMNRFPRLRNARLIVRALMRVKGAYLVACMEGLVPFIKKIYYPEPNQRHPSTSRSNGNSILEWEKICVLPDLTHPQRSCPRGDCCGPARD